MAPPVRLGVNIDHVATVRNARGGSHPDPVRAARVALEAGADGITAHLREDRRHITDPDIEALSALCEEADRPLNLEMAVTEEMLAIALRHQPHAACLVPERREEVTTEGGLDVAGQQARIAPVVRALVEGGIRVSLFIEPASAQVDAAAAGVGGRAPLGVDPEHAQGHVARVEPVAERVGQDAEGRQEQGAHGRPLYSG